MTANSPYGPRPDWVSDTLFPFRSRFFNAPRGALHFVDEGRGRTALVFVHGNPTWSFEYRKVIAALRGEARCIALDHLGFGLSARSADPADHHPEAHAANFAALMDHLGLDRIVPVFSDWGGPIALDFARRHPQRVAGFVILNSWCWPVDREPHFARFSAVMASWPMQVLIKRFNFFVRVVVPKAVVDRSVLTPEVMAHYQAPLPDPASRAAVAAFPGQILGATAWLGDIWNHRAAFAGKPALAVWGLKDIAFRPQELDVWRTACSDLTVQELPDCGHFLAEEAPDRVVAAIRDFLAARRVLA